jgi:hypothetical protein
MDTKTCVNWEGTRQFSAMKLDPCMENASKNIVDYFRKWNHTMELNTELSENVSSYI